jgi:uncharacterized membrane protein
MRLEKLYPVIMAALVIAVALLLSFNLAKKEKDGFTELYLVKNLPKVVEEGRTYDFSFGVHNFEYKDMVYDYSVSVQSDVIGIGTIDLEHDDSYIVTSNFTAENMVEKALISVKLLNKDQEIHFWTRLK